jgi:hypothetical protein
MEGFGPGTEVEVFIVEAVDRTNATMGRMGENEVERFVLTA